MLRVLDLFSGIGGFSLGLERTGGFKTVAFCEIDPFCRRVLANHWPGVKCYEDVRTLDAPTLQRDGIAVDAICGGFPCQDISSAGKRAGLAGERSGLWGEYSRLIGELRPRIAIVENVSDLRARGFGDVLGDLAALGYDAVWESIPASALGAPHRRDRVWVIAHANSWRQQERAQFNGATQQDSTDRDSRRRHADGLGYEVADADSQPQERPSIAWPERDPWEFEPDVGRVAPRLPGDVDRLRGLGNAVVPQIPELIGNAVLASMGLKAAVGQIESDGGER
jgi:DNA (cytosine-5)-methyltransferase 1